MDVRIDVLSEFVPFRNKKTADNPLPAALNFQLSSLNSQLSTLVSTTLKQLQHLFYYRCHVVVFILPQTTAKMLFGNNDLYKKR